MSDGPLVDTGLGVMPLGEMLRIMERELCPACHGRGGYFRDRWPPLRAPLTADPTGSTPDHVIEREWMECPHR